MGQRFQFSLSRLLPAIATDAVGLTFLLQSMGPIEWFATMRVLAGAAFGAATGLMCDRIGRFVVYRSILAIAFVVYLALRTLNKRTT